jgi:arylsulfatase A-like enzyme
VRWGDVTAGGGLNHAVMHVIDIMASCMELAGLECPRERDGRGVTPLEGESFAPILRGEAWSRREPLFWEHEGNRAVRLGDWKLVSQHPERWELYRIDEDRTELNDLARANGPRVKELESLYRGWAERCGVLPWDELARLP